MNLKFRAAFKDLISQIGRQLITGKFNLTRTSFPIKCMSKDSIVQVIASIAGPCAVHFNAAASANDPIQRMKHVITGSFAYLYPCHTWDKPLNPILGETFQACLPDGTKVYIEQVCHQPPISYMLFEGPRSSPYQWSGYSSLSVKAYINHIDLKVGGHKIIKFADGTQIVYDNQSDVFGNVLMGTMHHQLVGHITFTDEANSIQAYVDIVEQKNRPRDYFTGKILLHGDTVVSNIYGNYMGYVDFDDQRFFDVRNMTIQEVLPLREESLESDSRKRIDAMELVKGDVDQAQLNKNALEKQ